MMPLRCFATAVAADDDAMLMPRAAASIRSALPRACRLRQIRCFFFFFFPSCRADAATRHYFAIRE